MTKVATPKKYELLNIATNSLGRLAGVDAKVVATYENSGAQIISSPRHVPF